MPAITAQQMVDQIMLALQTTPVGTLSITVDGTAVTYSRAQALTELAFWEKRAVRESGGRPRASSIDLSTGFSTQ